MSFEAHGRIAGHGHDEIVLLECDGAVRSHDSSSRLAMRMDDRCLRVVERKLDHARVGCDDDVLIFVPRSIKDLIRDFDPRTFACIQIERMNPPPAGDEQRRSSRAPSNDVTVRDGDVQGLSSGCVDHRDVTSFSHGEVDAVRRPLAEKRQSFPFERTEHFAVNGVDEEHVEFVARAERDPRAVR